MFQLGPVFAFDYSPTDADLQQLDRSRPSVLYVDQLTPVFECLDEDGRTFFVGGEAIAPGHFLIQPDTRRSTTVR